mmetsp:Transcript_12576/g.30432  ORF Transcript_12576/g.30432 Transcript_12576/m.30432 type:complete len:494 (-) Transcript_12576:77-1558(-)
MAGLPPPPLPTGGPPPPPLPLPPNALPPGVPPPHMQPMNRRPGGPPGPGGLPFTTTVLVTGLPSFLHSFRSLRQWIFPCGTMRTVIFYPRPPRIDTDDSVNEKKKEETAPKKVTALVTLSHPDVAVKFVASFKDFSTRLDERYNAMQAYMVPTSPDVPLPPPVLDAEATKILGEKLWQNFVSLEGSDGDGNVRNKIGANVTKLEQDSHGKDGEGDGHGTGGNGDEIRIDVTKVAAAAGGAYDPDEDPLNAPHVLEAVKAFRRKLTETQSTDQKRRIEIVARKLEEMRPKIQAIVKQEKEQQRQAAEGGPPPPPLPTGLPVPPPGDLSSAPPPPPAGLPPPPPSGLPPPPMAAGSAAAGAAGDSGKRGRSNLPAWMTAQKQQQQQAGGNNTGEEAGMTPPASKKQKTGGPAQSHPTNFPPTLPQSTHEPLKQFLTKQVEESLGEADNTLIDFLYGHILGGKETSQLLEELQVVLEEEATAFLDAVWAKVHELHQ